MKTKSSARRTQQISVNDRQGSTLVVIIALMGMLSLLGVMFFTFASQEKENAENFLEASKRLEEADLGPEVYFDWALQQAISGPSPTLYNSALYGGRHAILSNQFGNDSHPHTGRGVSLLPDPSGNTTNFHVDQNSDGNADTGSPDNSHLLDINDSPVAHNRQNVTSQLTFPQPDVDYTYPDINNVFLAYVGHTLAQERDVNGNGVLDNEDTNNNGRLDSGEDTNGNGFLDSEDLNGNGVIDTNPVSIRVVKPSYHRPELLRSYSNWYRDAGVAGRVLRAHPGHKYVSTNTLSLPAVSRYLNQDGEDINGNGTLDPGEDTNGNGALDGPESGLLTSGGFFFRVDNDRDGTLTSNEAPRQGAWDITTKTHGLTPLRATNYDFDEDCDLDGIYEAILLDLDFPVQEDSSNGKLYLPMFGITILDADGLLNLNAHGNLAGNSHGQVGANGYPFIGPANRPAISLSLHGLSSYEVNPIWGLSAQPADVSAAGLGIYSNYFGGNPSNWLDLANMDFWMLNKGRGEVSGGNPKITAGRLGDPDRIYNVFRAANTAGNSMITFNTLTNSNAFPFPGIWNQDDNRDRNEGGQYDLSQAATINNMALGQTLRSRHPLSYGGAGRFWYYNTGNAADPANYRQLDTVGPPNNPTRWIRYTNYQLAGDSDWRSLDNQGVPGNYSLLMPNAIAGVQFQAGAYAPQAAGNTQLPLFDDMTEMTLEHRFLRRPYDEPFSYEDFAGIAMSETDFTSTGIKSRLRDLAPANMNPGYNSLAAQIRKRFTTESWDRKQFGLALSNAVRTWEFNHDTDNDGKFEFPPTFGGIVAYSALDPFRPQLRRILAVENGNTNQFAMQFRLGLNQLLDVQRSPGTTPNPVTFPLEYRPLTPHPTTTLTNLVPQAQPAFPPTTDEAREYWARRDRQAMARDIYVMLATFCRGELGTPANPVNPTAATAYASGEQRALLREMAQFAVNVVDALDRDNVMTIFEYDINLSNGWNLDDDAYFANGSETDRAVVVGVERQELALSETLWMWQDKLAADNSHTPFDEMVNDHNFLFMELRNLQPTPVPLGKTGVSTSRSTAAWRIRRTDSAAIDETKIPEGPVSVTVQPTENCLYFKANAGSIAAGAQYNIATGDAYLGLGQPVDLYVDVDTTASTFELIAPNAVGSSTYTTNSPPTTGQLGSRCDLDLVVDNTFSKHDLEAGTTAGSFLDRTTAPLVPTDVQLVLERRLNPDQPQLSVTENPWIVVDFMRARRQSLGINPSDDNTTIPTILQSKKSWEREQPLDAEAEAYYGGAASTRMNSLNQTGTSLQPANSNTPLNGSGAPEYTIQQLHFDRDFASTVELFHIPAGPTTASGPPDTSALTIPAVGCSKWLTRILKNQNLDNQSWLARQRFVNPSTPIIPNVDTGSVYGNQWHRLLSFLEVPSKAHRQLGDAFLLTRTPGKINLNTIRDPEVLGGLLDCPEHILAPDTAASPARYGLESYLPAGVTNPIYFYSPNPNVGKAGASGRRDVWADFLAARDGVDPITQIPLPGTPAAPAIRTEDGARTGGSRPFRDLSYDSNGLPTGSSVEHSILRGQLADAAKWNTGAESADVADGRQDRMFDIGSVNDPYVKSRLLSKIMGNATTRSNVFVVYMTVRFHEVYEDPSGNQRIGGRYDLNHNGNATDDTHRGFFILDRSNAEEAYNANTATFNWRNIVKYRLTIN